MRKLLLAFFFVTVPATRQRTVRNRPFILPSPSKAPRRILPLADAYADDGMGYDDGTLSIRIEQNVAYNTKIYYVYIQLTDASQFRTALRGTVSSPKPPAM